MLVTMLKKKTKNKKPLWKMLKIWIIEKRHAKYSSGGQNYSTAISSTSLNGYVFRGYQHFTSKVKNCVCIDCNGFCVCVCDFLLVSLFNNKYCVTENLKQHERAKSRKDVLTTNIKVFLWSFGDTDIKIKPYTCVYLMFSVITRCSGIIIEYYGSLLGSLRNITAIVGL